MIYIFLDEYTRAMAGLVLKNNLLSSYNKHAPDVIACIKQESLSCMSNPLPMIRSTAGTLITTIVSLGGLQSWPEVIPKLIECMDSQDEFLIQVHNVFFTNYSQGNFWGLEKNMRGFKRWTRR